MILGGWKKPLLGFLFSNLVIFWLFYLSGLPFSYLYDESLRNYYLMALQRESLMYGFIFLLFPDRDLRLFRLKGENFIYFMSISFLMLEIFLLDLDLTDYSENSNKGTTFFELGALMFVLSSWRYKVLSRHFLFGFFLVLVITVFSGKRMALSFIFMRLLYNISIYLSIIQYCTMVFFSFILLTISSFMREGIVDVSYIFSNAVLSSNHGGILHAAGVYLEAERALDWASKWKLFFYNLVAPWFVSLSLLPLEGSINNYFIINFREIQGNGGFISSYLKFFGIDLFAILLLAFLVNIWKNLAFLDFFITILLIIGNRFFYYNIGSSIRLISLVLILYFLSRIIILSFKSLKTN